MARIGLVKIYEGKIVILCPKCKTRITADHPIIEYGVVPESIKDPTKRFFYYDRKCTCGVRVRYYKDSMMSKIYIPEVKSGKEKQNI